MNKIFRSLQVLTLALVGLMGCNFELRTVGDVNPTHVAEAKQVLRDLWVGHIFWVRHVVLNNATHNPEARDAAEEEVVTNARQIASTMTPFYGEATTKELFSLLDINYGAVKEYSEATVAGNKRRQDAALTRLASNANDLAYGEIRCVGKKDECVGEYTFLWGRGGFKGITGTTPFIGGIYIEQQKEGQLHGTVHWPEMNLFTTIGVHALPS